MARTKGKQAAWRLKGRRHSGAATACRQCCLWLWAAPHCMPAPSPLPTALPRRWLPMLTPPFGPPGSEDYRSRFSSECLMDLVCPDRCRCEGTIVDCSNQKLARAPSHLPEHVTDL